MGNHYESARERARLADAHRQRIRNNMDLLELAKKLEILGKTNAEELNREIRESEEQISQLEGWKP